MHTIGRYLADTAEGQNFIELSDILRGDARLFSFRVQDAEAGPCEALSLPDAARVICIYGDGVDLRFADPGAELAVGDEVVILARARTLPELRERFGAGRPGRARSN
jgi:trk system potassium uptake protein TrkA